MEKEIESNSFVMPRFGQGEQLLSEYDLSVDNVSKGRGSLLIYSGKQTFMLKEFHGSKDKAKALAKVLQELAGWDGENETLVATKDGEYLVREEGGPSYLLKTYHGGRECDVKNPLEVLEGVRKLGELHITLRELSVEQEEVFYAPEHSLPRELYRHNREMRNLKNYIRKKKRKNAFEERYEEVYEIFYNQAMQVEKLIQEDGAFLEESGGYLCHGDFHHHNVVDCGHRSVILHYDNMRLDSQMSDLAKYVRKVLEKNHWNKELGMEIISTYERVRKPEREEWTELCLRLSYPEKFWKIANHYNNNKKAWASKRDGEKLMQIIAQEEARQEFLMRLYNRKE
ncbi:MAG: hypothetical protein PUB19_05365 [Lachnospiraceae bacterium]|nr:hypothetical protein [Lachnospiraceae bacterium]